MSRPNEYRDCGRCGRRTIFNTRAKAPGICWDCRTADPHYVRVTRAAYIADAAALKQRKAWIRDHHVTIGDVH